MGDGIMQIAINSLEYAKTSIETALILMKPYIEGVTPKYNPTEANFVCPNCSLVLDEGRDEHCPSCGALIKWDEATTQEEE